MTRQQVEDLLLLWDVFGDQKSLEEPLFADGFDEAIIGLAEPRWGQGLRVVYSIEKCQQILMRDMNTEEDGAREYFEFNVLGSYVGDNTPLFIITESL